VAELASFGEADPAEVRGVGVDLSTVVQAEVAGLEKRAARAGVELRMAQVAKSRSPGVVVRAGPRAVSLLVRELVSHAIAASPPGSAVAVSVEPPDGDMGARLIVDDSGTILPAAARRALLALEVEPGTFGRPSGVSLFMASELSRSQGIRLDVADAPVGSGGGGGVRVCVTFPR
jgi:signal transduction histidine kinase